MKIYRTANDRGVTFGRRAIAIGIFDGVHRGHAKILSTLKSVARRMDASPMVVTFDPHPVKILSPKKYHPTILMSLEHRFKYFEKLGIREVLVMKFTKKFSRMTRQDFLEKFLLKQLGAVGLVVGHDFRFGRYASGDGSFLKHCSKELGYDLSIVKALKYKNEIISSTRVRLLIERGCLKEAAGMLGRLVSVTGTVIHGRGRGKKVGFPTANLNPHHEALPPEGVYAAYGFIGKKKLKGVIHIGKRPTFHDGQKSLEVHFLNFKKEIYGQEIELMFVKRLRGTRRFASVNLLRQAISDDIFQASKVL